MTFSDFSYALEGLSHFKNIKNSHEGIYLFLSGHPIQLPDISSQGILPPIPHQTRGLSALFFF